MGNVAEIENSKKLGMIQLYLQETKENVRNLCKKLIEREGRLEELDQHAAAMEDSFEIFKNYGTQLKIKVDLLVVLCYALIPIVLHRTSSYFFPKS